MSDATTGTVRWVERFHAVVDELAEPLVRAHAGKLACREGCAGCCADDLTVFDIEAELIRERHGALLTHGTPAPTGGCAFLDDEARCRIYADRPYVCRTQGLPLRWLEVDEVGPVEMRDVCPESAPAVDLAQLTAEELWLIGPFEAKLAEKQEASGTGGAARVSLRGLFVRQYVGRGPKLPIVP